MNKDTIIDQLTENVKNELRNVQNAYDAQQKLVVSGDLKSDGKYDTRGTEAKYLADGQRQRISELGQELELLEVIPKKSFGPDDKIAIGALVEIEFNELKRKYFISPTAGGTMLNIEGEVVLVISVFSPIGDGALGLTVDDDFEIEMKGETRNYTLCAIW